MMASTDSAGALPQMISTSAHPALSSSSRRRLHSQQRRTGRPNGHGPVNLVQNGERQHRRHICRCIRGVRGRAGHAVHRRIYLPVWRICKVLKKLSYFNKKETNFVWFTSTAIFELCGETFHLYLWEEVEHPCYILLHQSRIQQRGCHPAKGSRAPTLHNLKLCQLDKKTFF